MSDSDGSKSAGETVKPQIKRKRKEVIDTSDEDGESKTKKQRRLSNSSESLNDEDVSSEKSDGETEKLETPKTNKKSQESSSDEEKSDDEKVKKSTESGNEDESGHDDESKTGDKKKSDESSDDEKEEKEEDSDSSSLPSLDDDKEVEAAKKVAQKKSKGNEGKSDMKNKEDKSVSDTSSASQSDDENDGESKKKQGAKKKSEKAKGSKEDNKSVVRLKRYIALCGVRRNYKKILGDCRSVQAMVAVLKKELEDLGVEGQPSIQKCKKARMKREEARELAELNMDNIIHSEGRASRRGTASGRKQEDARSSMYKHAVNSSSGSDQENKGNGGRRRIDWSNLQGIISDDGDSA